MIPALLVLSCSKSATGGKSTTGTDTASIIGTWIWAEQTKPLWDSTSLAELSPATTGIHRTLIFDTAGHFTLIHNDSIFSDSTHIHPILLRMAEPFRLLAAPETDTGTYRVSFGIVGWCAYHDTTEVILQNIPYQALLSADTLLVYLDPCITRIADIYIRKP